MSDPKILSDDEAFASLIPITDEERATCAPMSEALFMAAIRFKKGATLEQHITALDRAGYWGDKSISLLEKRTHTRHKLETISAPTRHDTAEIVAWIQENYPGAPLVMSEEVLDAVARHAHAERWHPDQLNEALTICAGDIDELHDGAA